MIHGNHSSAVREVIPAHDDKRVLARSDKYCPEGRFYALRPFQNIIALLIFSFLALSCHTGTEPANSNIQLTTVDVGVTWVAVGLHFNGQYQNKEFMLRRDGLPLAGGIIHALDTVFEADSLLPKHTYTFHAYIMDSGKVKDSSDLLTLSTMDTTSHSIAWEMEYFGGQNGGCALYDVAIVNDSMAIACGEIYLNGANCNIVWWKHGQWTLEEVLIQEAGLNNYSFARIKSVQAFSERDIWAASDAELLRYNGDFWVEKKFLLNGYPFVGSINKIWGSGDDNIYMVGENGAIYHYTGDSTCKTLASGTTLNFADVYGAVNSATGDTEIYAVAAKRDLNWDRAIVKITGDSVRAMPTDAIGHQLVSCWFKPGGRFYAAGDGLFTTASWRHWQWKSDVNTISNYYFEKIRGYDVNNIFICGDYGEMIHFSGVSWHSYMDQLYLYDGRYFSFDIKGKLIIAVGEDNPRAAIAVGIAQ